MSPLELPSRQSPIPSQAREPGQVPTFPVRRFLLEEYLQLVDAGFFGTARVELWEGWVVERMTHGALASAVIMILDELLRASLPRGFALRVQLPLLCDESCPEPDLAIVSGQSSDFRKRHPLASEAPLVIEVSDSTLSEDRRHKQALYARSRVPQFWIVNCVQRQIEVYTNPTGPMDQPTYRDCRIVDGLGTVTVPVANGAAGEIAVAGLFTE